MTTTDWPVKRRAKSVMWKLLDHLKTTGAAMEASEISDAIGSPLISTKAALSGALSQDRVHVDSVRTCTGGRKFLYRIGPKPPGAPVAPGYPFEEVLAAMQKAARESRTLHGKASS